MKTKFPGKKKRTAGVTLVEMLVATAAMSMLMAGFLIVHLFGMRLYGISEAKTGASDDARISLSRMANEIREAWTVKVGEGDLTKFSEVKYGNPQEGSAVQIHPTSDTNKWIRYYLDKTDFTLRRATDSDIGGLLMAHSMAAETIFTSEDFKGTVLTNNYNNRVIGLKLQIKQFQYPLTRVGNGGIFDYYQINTKFTRRKLE